jgi:hypothetical protein
LSSGSEKIRQLAMMNPSLGQAVDCHCICAALLVEFIRELLDDSVA